MSRLLAVIPARGGSKGLPGKNVRPFLGRPLIAWSIEYARQCPEITRAIVSTDSEEIAGVAKHWGGDVPFLRPPRLAADHTPLWDVLRHALSSCEGEEGRAYDEVLLLDPTSPAREPSDVAQAAVKLRARPEAHGIVGVSRPDFNPVWHSVVEREGWMQDLVEASERITRRQDAPVVYRINGALYLWRASFVRTHSEWRGAGKHLLHELPERRAMSIDTLEEFERAELLMRHGFISLSWLSTTEAGCAR